MKALISAGYLLAALTGLGAEPTTWRFESVQTGWQPRAKTIKLERVAGARDGSAGTLHIQGRIDEGWNYALTERWPMKGGEVYRLSAWLRVNELGPGTPAPFLKCEFIADNNRYVGRVQTELYDRARMGTWQQLTTEFPAPEGTRQFWLALEKGSSGSAEIDAYLDDVRVDRIERLTLLEQFRIKPIPPALEKFRGVHPRLYVDTGRVGELRQASTTTHASMWQKVRELADGFVRRGPPAYRERDNSSGDEQLWQREVGNTMPTLAMAWLMTGEGKYLEAASQWAVASCNYKTWGLGGIDGMDLATGHQLLGLALVYDWCYADLTPEVRATIRAMLIRRTQRMFEAAAGRKAWWHRSYMQNHLWVNITGMAAAGMALFDEADEATMWIGLPLEKFQRTMDAMGSDGASHEGVGYWEYGVEYMMKFMDLGRARLGVNLYTNKWWGNTAYYSQYLALPRAAWTRGNCIVDIADCPRGHWYGPEYLLRGLAREFRDGHAQWLAGQVDEAGVSSPGAAWLNLVWYDPTVAARRPETLPTLRHFADMGLVSARSDWSGKESLLVFKCGPFIGHEAMEKFTYDPGGGHVHPDANHFVLFGAGEWLVRDDGYRAKWTGQHNTLLVDGRGQLGEGKQWFDGPRALAAKARPKVVRAVAGGEMDQVSGDAREAYPRELGLQRYVRHLIYVKPDVLLVCDDIATDVPRALELRFHPESRQSKMEGGALVMRGANSVLRLEPLAAGDVKVSAEDLPCESRHGEPGQKMFTVRMSKRAASWRNAVALSWASSDGSPQVVKGEVKGDAWKLKVGTKVISLDWSTGLARVSAN